jgi:hypothetical protein
MKIDGTIGSSVAFGLFLAAFVLGGNWLEARRNPRPPITNYRKDGGMPWVAFWNLFDESKFTPQAIEFHRRRLRAIPILLAAFAVGWLILDFVW